MAKVKTGVTAVAGEVILDAPSDVKIDEAPAAEKAPDAVVDEKVVTEADVAPKAPEVKPTPPASDAKKLFRVTLNDKSGVYSARDKDEAWALFCDHNKSWPSPKIAGKEIVEV